jgi:transposase-like protein
MTPPKLSESEKIEIIDLYRETEENTITLAERFGVSSSTVRRLLQSTLSEDEYKTLVQQKQKRSVQSADLPEELPTKVAGKKRQKKQVVAETIEEKDEIEEVTPVVSKRGRQAGKKAKLQIVEPLESTTLAEDDHGKKRRSKKVSVANSDLIEPIAELPISTKDLVEMFDLEVSQNQTFADFDDAFDDTEDDDGLESFSDDDHNDGELDDPLPANTAGNFRLSLSQDQQSLIQILPLSVAILPRTCYLVVDRSAELVTKPLMAFAELGRIPPEEIQEKTLPIFDNHRVAKRFSERNQKVLKVPDGKIFAKTIGHLRKKGITRFLIDGRVYYF